MSAWDCVRLKSPKRDVYKQIWHRIIPLKISFFVWRLIANCLPTDDVLARYGVHGPSICSCCITNPTEETIKHLFFNSQVAQHCWNVFGEIFNVKLEQNCSDLMTSWNQEGTGNKNLDQIAACLPLFILWEIWRARNFWKFEGRRPFLTGIINNIKRNVQYRLPADLQEFSWNTVVVQPAMVNGPRLIYWTLPPDPFIKVNTDGSSKGNSGIGGGGGVARDSSGSFIFAFTVSFGIVTALEAEAYAMLKALEIFRERGYKNAVMETDSRVLYFILNDVYEPPGI